MRGRKCWPLVWIDGNPMPAGEVDLDSFVPSSIQGIELYLGTTTVPMAYVMNQSLSSCGTILLWSRGPDTDPIRAAPRSWLDLEDMVTRNSVFTAKSVDRAARLDSTQTLNLVFPPSLFASRTPGLVIAEFIVGANGKVEENTVGVVSSTSPLFTESVRTALLSATFIPAVKNGKAVRQLVQQPFEFSVDRAGSRETSAR
jgi:TonB family protein